MTGVTSAPVWVRFSNLPVRYWNIKSLSAISSLVGVPLMTDRITKERTWLNFSRVLIEVELRKEALVEVQFVNEYGQLVDQVVEYDWLPVKCSCCSNFGHMEADCRKKEEVWQAKTIVPNSSEEIVNPPPHEPASMTNVSDSSDKNEEPWITPRIRRNEKGKQQGSNDMKQKSIIVEQNSIGRPIHLECKGAQLGS